MKLATMKEYVLEHPATFDYEYLCGKLLKYAQLLDTPLKLEMLVAVDDNDKMMKKPNDAFYPARPELFQERLNEYETKQKKIMFTGFEVVELNERVSFFHDGRCVLTYSFVTNKFLGPARTIEYLTNFGLEYLKQQI